MDILFPEDTQVSQTQTTQTTQDTTQTTQTADVQTNQTAQATQATQTTQVGSQLGYSQEELAQFVKIYDEFRANPYAFIVKYVPELIPKDDYSFITKALTQEFGEDFKPDPNEVFIPGTKSNLYLVRQQQLINEYEANKRRLEEERVRREEEFKKKFDLDKKNVMEKYKLDENAFNSFWEKLANTEISLEILYKGLFFDELVENIKKQLAEQIREELSKNIPPSPNQISTASNAVDKDLADFGFF